MSNRCLRRVTLISSNPLASLGPHCHFTIGGFSSFLTVRQDAHLQLEMGCIYQAFYNVRAHSHVGLFTLCATYNYFFTKPMKCSFLFPRNSTDGRSLVQAWPSHSAFTCLQVEHLSMKWALIPTINISSSLGISLYYLGVWNKVMNGIER